MKMGWKVVESECRPTAKTLACVVVSACACASGACVHRHSSQPCSEASHQHLTIKQAVSCFTSPSELETFNVYLKTAVFCLVITV